MPGVQTNYYFFIMLTVESFIVCTYINHGVTDLHQFVFPVLCSNWKKSVIANLHYKRKSSIFRSVETLCAKHFVDVIKE